MTNASKVLNIAKTDEKNLFQFLNNSTHEQACAETNSITKLYQDGDRLIFLHSQTEEGKLRRRFMPPFQLQEDYKYT